MAKVKEEVKESKGKIEDITNELLKKYGKGVITTADKILSKPQTIISVSPVLDIGLSGGIPMGIMAIFSGKPKAGKSTTALQLAAHCQAQNIPTFYLDVEGRVKDNHKLLNGINGLDPEKLHVIASTPEKILNAVDYLTIAEELIKTVPNSMIIIDSSSALCDSSERTEDMTANTRAKGPKLMATFCRRNRDIVSINGCLVVIIQHLIANTSGYGSPFMEDGGNKIIHAADIKIRAKGFSDWARSDKTLIGQVVRWEVVFSALGAPGAEIESYIRYGYGIDKEWEIINMALEMGLITKGGAWYTLDFMGENAHKVQGQEKVWEIIKDNPPLRDELFAKVKAML